MTHASVRGGFFPQLYTFISQHFRGKYWLFTLSPSSKGSSRVIRKSCYCTWIYLHFVHKVYMNIFVTRLKDLFVCLCVWRHVSAVCRQTGSCVSQVFTKETSALLLRLTYPVDALFEVSLFKSSTEMSVWWLVTSACVDRYVDQLLHRFLKQNRKWTQSLNVGRKETKSPVSCLSLVITQAPEKTPDFTSQFNVAFCFIGMFKTPVLSKTIFITGIVTNANADLLLCNIWGV